MKTTMIATGLALLAAPGLAQDANGDAAAGEAVFKQCATCHVVVNDAGETLAGRNGKVGPNLYGVAGRTAGTVEGFNYGDAIVKAGEQGLEWTEDNFVAYVQNPSGFLQEYLADKTARTKMVYHVRSEEDAANVYAYLASLASGSGGAAATN